jgi:hypothetical protein
MARKVANQRRSPMRSTGLASPSPSTRGTTLFAPRGASASDLPRVSQSRGRETSEEAMRTLGPAQVASRQPASGAAVPPPWMPQHVPSAARVDQRNSEASVKFEVPSVHNQSPVPHHHAYDTPVAAPSWPPPATTTRAPPTQVGAREQISSSSRPVTTSRFAPSTADAHRDPGAAMNRHYTQIGEDFARDIGSAATARYAARDGPTEMPFGAHEYSRHPVGRPHLDTTAAYTTGAAASQTFTTNTLQAPRAALHPSLSTSYIAHDASLSGQLRVKDRLLEECLAEKRSLQQQLHDERATYAAELDRIRREVCAEIMHALQHGGMVAVERVVERINAGLSVSERTDAGGVGPMDPSTGPEHQASRTPYQQRQGREVPFFKASTPLPYAAVNPRAREEAEARVRNALQLLRQPSKRSDQTTSN